MRLLSTLALTTLFPVLWSGAVPDLRLIEGAKTGKVKAIRSLLAQHESFREKNHENSSLGD